MTNQRAPPKKQKIFRSDPDFIKRLRSIIPDRMRNGLEDNPRALSDRELTRMLKNTDAFELSLEELRTKRRRNE